MRETKELQDKYFKELIVSIRSGNPIQFAMEVNIVQENRDFLLFVDKVGKLQIEYAGIRKLYNQDHSGLVRYILAHLKKYKEEYPDADSYDIIKCFFKELDYAGLSNGLRAKYDEGIDILEKKIQYFCSYTTKGLPEINTTYKRSISPVFGVNSRTDVEQWKQTNYLAKLIVRYFNTSSLNNYFLDVDRLVNGDEIEEKVLEYCGRAVVLVILVQNETFLDKGGETNWCFKEYQHYNETHQHNRHFIVYRIPDIPRPVGGREEILAWYDYLSRGTGILSTVLPYTWTADIIKRKIVKDAEIIKKACEKVFEDLIRSI
jgi:hypothetical protein